MKKTVYSLLFISALGFCQTEKRVGDFTKVTSFDKIDVVLIQSNENKVILSGNESENVELINKNGELKIRMPLLKTMSGDGINATVYFKKIDAVEANEGSHMTSDEIFKSIVFEIIVKEGADIKLNIDVENLKVKATSGGILNIEGEATNQDILVNSGAIFDGSKINSKQATVTVNAGGEVGVFAIDFVNAKVRAGGKITVFGNPKQLNKKVIAGGTIEEAK
jgi:hypothetical protein